MPKAQFTEKQLYILEAALRFSIDQVESCETKVLDWGDGAVYQLDRGHDEFKQTSQLLEDSLATLQRMKDEIK